MDRKEIGDKVRYVRERKHLTQQNMADALGMSSAKQYSRYETGESKLDMELLERIATVLEMTLIELLSYDESVSFNHCIQHHVMGSNNTYHENGLKERELYEARIKALEDVVAELRKDKDFLQEQLAAVRKKR